MAIIKCKMCGGQLNIEPESTICECEYCGSKQTIPNTDDEKRLKLYERANRLRFDSEFDKAAGVYESIVADYQEEAEAYWGLVLCKYGIEYVDDPATGKKVPTCHRSSFDSVMDDANFELVMENADSVARSVYREEAKQIEEIRKGIIEVSSTEEPYDIFICYKETDDKGDRTIDSEIAQDVYNELTEKGYRVFFSRITLEDKLGQEYEPYIFAALNSAKVMLAFGTSYDYYNAVWVKNEWSRFLKLIAEGQKKTLIPCFKDIDAYDIPKEFKRLQAQDMGKVGAVQDLIRGIEKLIGKKNLGNNESALSTGNVNNTNVIDVKNTAYLKRGYLALEEKEWNKADGFFEEALNLNAECAEAYLGKWLAENKAESLQDYKKICFANIKKEIESIKNDPTKHVSVIACDVDHSIVEEIKKYAVPNVDGLSLKDINKACSEFGRRYYSAVPVLKKFQNQYKDPIEKSIYIQRVLEFGNEKLIDDIKKLKALISTKIDECVLAEEKKDNKKIEQIKVDYQGFLNDILKNAKVQYAEWEDSREQRYEESKIAVELILKGQDQNLNVYEVEKNLKMLNGFGNSDELLGIVEKEIEYRQLIDWLIRVKDSIRKKYPLGKYISIEGKIKDIKTIQTSFQKYADYREAAKYSEQCRNIIDDYNEKEPKYKNEVCSFYENGSSFKVLDFHKKQLKELQGYRDADEYIMFYESKMEDMYLAVKDLLNNRHFKDADKLSRGMEGYKDVSELRIKNKIKDKTELIGLGLVISAIIFIILFI
ncbi:MAG: toll/interleukin-1 receptor domain-containing protein [Eubacterium sp.]|nr:toll/interleukin-1 receptor domain-containing protein [Eubacterium sp.]